MFPLFASATTDGTHLHRISRPAAAIPQAVVLPLGFQEFPEGATHIIFQTFFCYQPGQQLAMFKACRQAGLKIILDIDDHWTFDENHRNAAAYHRDNHTHEIKQCVKSADMVWCASRKLTDECLKLNKESHYIPNCSSNILAAPKVKAERFGYVSAAMDHLEDAKTLVPAFELLAKNGPMLMPRVTVGWCGYRRNDPKSDDMLQLFQKAGAYFSGEYLPPNMYEFHYRNIDVALAPLVANQFGQYKSALKAVEAGANGCAFICSDSPVFDELDHGTHCLKASSAFDWYRHIKKMHKDPTLAHDLAANLQDHVKQAFDPQHWANERMQLMQTI